MIRHFLKSFSKTVKCIDTQSLIFKCAWFLWYKLNFVLGLAFLTISNFVYQFHADIDRWIVGLTFFHSPHWYNSAPLPCFVFGFYSFRGFFSFVIYFHNFYQVDFLFSPKYIGYLFMITLIRTKYPDICTMCIKNEIDLIGIVDEIMPNSKFS